MSYSHGINSARRLGDLAHLFQTDHNPTISLEMLPSPAPTQSSSTVPATEVGGEGMLGRELAASPQRRGDFHPCCRSLCCSRQLLPLSQLGPLLPISHAQRVALRWGDGSCCRGEEGGWGGCMRPDAEPLEPGRALPLVFNLLWIVAIIIRIISSR